MTIEFNDPVRINMPVELGPYTFLKSKTQGGGIINLTTAFIPVSVWCELKRQGAAMVTVSGSIVDGPGGIVHVASYTFTGVGIWQYQFYCLNASGAKLWGEPVQFYAAKNEEDAGLEELLPD